MPLPSGTQLGPYEILAPLGAGGMGEVYRARDARLAREVAIKVLPASFSQDAERLRRFEHEAKATGALNHPNILAVYDTGHHDGAPYVVSELLEGETLRDRMAGGALPLRKAVEIGAQIARGLAAAHEKGIVHRDLKPENVFVTNEGHVKILDFGLAKLTQIEASEESQSATRTRQTDPGVVLGTAGYMSPEQVRGAPVDHRSDIFSLGTVLYEMLAGRRAFKKETSAETMAAILREDPPDLTESGKALPPALERIVAHCLEKNPQERFASARDLAFDLESLSEKSGATTTARARRDPSARRGWWIRIAGGLILAAALSALSFWLGERHAERPLPTYRRISLGHGADSGARFTPDGASIVYSAAWNGAPDRIFLTRLDSPGESALGLEGRVVGATATEVAFLRDDRTLAQAPISGGGVREVAEGVVAADWTRDGARFAITRIVGPKMVLEYPIGNALYESVGSLGSVAISPDGNRLATIEAQAVGATGRWLVVADAGGARRITAGSSGPIGSPVWSPDGSEIWFTMAEPQGGWSIRAASLGGRERVIARPPHQPFLWAAGADRRVLLSLGTSRQHVSGRAPGQQTERDLSMQSASQSWDISQDGKRFVIIGNGRGREASAFIGSLDGAPPVRLGSGEPNAISPDGRAVLVWLHPGKDEMELAILPTGAGQPRPVPRGSLRTYFDVRWLPDGRRLLISGSEAGRPTRLFVQELPDGLPKPITPEGVFTGYAFASPDGGWVPAGTNVDEAPFALYPVAGGDPRPIPGLKKGETPIRFTSDGRRLFVRSGVTSGRASSRIDTTARIVLLDLASGRREPWRDLAPADPAGVDNLGFVYITPDGSGYVYNYMRILADLFMVEGLR